MCKALGPIPSSTVKNDGGGGYLSYLKLSESYRADTSGEINDAIL